jgi:hypothetical protein
VVLTKTFDAEEYDRGLASWTWLDFKGKVPVFASLFADVFFQDPDGYWYLSWIDGTLTKIARSRDELQSILDSEEGQDQYLLGSLAMAAERRGLLLGDEDAYVYAPHPAFGGGFGVERIIVMSFALALNLTGQLHDQLRNMSPGFKVTGFELVEE